MALEFNADDWANFVIKILIPGILVACLLLVLVSQLEGQNLFGESMGSFFTAFGGDGNVHL